MMRMTLASLLGAALACAGCTGKSDQADDDAHTKAKPTVDERSKKASADPPAQPPEPVPARAGPLTAPGASVPDRKEAVYDVLAGGDRPANLPTVATAR